MPRGHIETYPSTVALFAIMQVSNKHCIVFVVVVVVFCFFLN